MAVRDYQEMAEKHPRKIQSNGEASIPATWRDKHGIEAGDTVEFIEQDDGSLRVIPAE